MPTPSQTFDAALTDFRARLKASIDKELIDRWLADGRAEQIWEKIQRHTPDLTAPNLIQQVIRARRSAAASVVRLFGSHLVPGFNAEWEAHVPKLRKHLREVLKGSPSTINPFYVWRQLAWAAQDVLLLWDHYLGGSDQVTFNLKREGSNQDRSRAAFEVLMSDFFQKHSKRKFKLHEVVGVLSEIAIPGRRVDRDNVVGRQRRRRPKT
jgi:hypothetical protein